MQVRQVQKEHPLNAISVGALEGLKKDKGERDKNAQLQPERNPVVAMVNDMFARIKRDGSVWVGYARQIVAFTIEQRVMFVGLIDNELQIMRKANTFGESDDAKKQAAARVASAAVMVTRMRTIARAFNGAATVDGLCKYAWETSGKPADLKGKALMPSLDDIGLSVISEYAGLFSDAKAGAPKKTVYQRLEKWMKDTEVHAGDAKGQAIKDAVAKVLASFA
jgi:hypothetical protein